MLISILVSLAFELNAQENLSLGEAIQKGLMNNYDITIIKKNVEIAENQNSQGQAGRWPSLQFSTGGNYNANEQIESASPFQPEGVIPNYSISPSLSLNWTVFEGFRVNISKRRFEKLQLESEGNADIVVSNTIQAIILGYYLLRMEQERLDVFERTLHLSRDRYQYVKLQKEYGTAITTDLLLEENNYLTDSVNYINQELTFRQALRALNTLLAEEDLDRQYMLTDRMDIPDEEYNLTDLEGKMMSNNVDLRTKYISQSIIKEDLKLAQSERYPKLNLGVSATNSWGWIDQRLAKFYNSQTGEYETSPFGVRHSESRNYAMGFSLSYNLFNGRRINTAIKNAVIREDIGNVEIGKMELSLKEDLYNNFDNYRFRKRIYDINKRKLEAAELNLKVTEDKFKLGAINSFDFRTIQINSLTAALQELNARYSLIESRVALMRLTGVILEAYQ